MLKIFCFISILLIPACNYKTESRPPIPKVETPDSEIVITYLSSN